MVLTSQLLIFRRHHRVLAGYCRAEGMIKNVNTVEEYRTLDKTAMLHRAGQTASLDVWDELDTHG